MGEPPETPDEGIPPAYVSDSSSVYWKMGPFAIPPRNFVRTRKRKRGPVRMRADEPRALLECKTAKILRKPYKTAVEKTRILWYYNGAASIIGRVAETGAPKRTWTAGGRANEALFKHWKCAQR